MANLLFVDATVQDIELFIECCNKKTYVVAYKNNMNIDALFETVDKFNVDKFENLAFVFNELLPECTQFVNNKYYSHSETIKFINEIIDEYNVKTLDFLSCSLLKHTEWEVYFKNFNIQVRYSLDELMANDWTLESHYENVKNIYFKNEIDSWKHKLNVNGHIFLILTDNILKLSGTNRINKYIYEEITNIKADDVKQIFSNEFNTNVLFKNNTVQTFSHNYNKHIFTKMKTYDLQNINQISCGDEHTLFLSKNGTVYSVGSNEFGQLGLGNVKNTSTPKIITSLSNAIHVACGPSFSVVLINDGTVRTFGSNKYKQLGHQNQENCFFPTEIHELKNVSKIACGSKHTLFLLFDNSLFSCGNNLYAQLGIGTKNDDVLGCSLTKINKFTDIKIIQMACGHNHSLILLENGTLYGFGNSTYGQLANFLLAETVPKIVYNSYPVIQISCNGDTSFILLKNKKITTYGRENFKNSEFLNIKNAFYVSGSSQVNTESYLTTNYANYHSFITLSNNSIFASGNNFNSQLGTNDNQNTNTFKEIHQLKNIEILQISINFGSSCILKKDGSVTCFGADINNIEISNACQVSCGYDHLLFLLKGGFVKGHNINFDNNLMGVMQISSGNGFSVALLKDGTVYTFGKNMFGQLGHGDFCDKYVPEKVKNIENVKQVKCGGNHILFLLHDDTVMSCGDNTWGQLGTNSNINSNIPVKIIFNDVSYHSKKILQISCGMHHSFVLFNNGTIYSFGNNMQKQCSLKEVDYISSPVKIETNGIAMQICCFGNSSLILMQNGSLFGCGSNIDGSLGLNNIDNCHMMKIEMENVKCLPDWIFEDKEVNYMDDDKEYNTFIIDDNNDVYSCGSNKYGQLGIGDNDDRQIFTKIPELCNLEIQQISKGVSFVHVLLKDFSIISFGLNDKGMLGLNDTNNRNLPTKNNNFKNDCVMQIACGYDHTLFLLSDFTVKSVGANNFGQLGLGGNIPNKMTPTTIQNLTNIIYISCGFGFSLVLTRSGHIKTFGLNNYGQLGVGDTNNRFLPENVIIDGTVIDAKCGGNFILFLLKDGTLLSCGDNGMGQLGINCRIANYVPIKVCKFPNVDKISCGISHSLILLKDENVYAFGSNYYGQFGINDNTDSLVPLHLTNLKKYKIKNIYCFGNSTQLITNDGKCICYGKNDNNILGLEINTKKENYFAKILPEDVKRYYDGATFSRYIANMNGYFMYIDQYVKNRCK